ncbi:MAG TPA: hypothetical protein VGM98_18055 [Schlesneria sp.]
MTTNISEPKRTNDSESVAWWNPLHWPAAIWVFLIVLGLMTSPFVIRAFMLAGIPDMPEPFDEVAYSTWDVPAADDAFTYYREATALHQQIIVQFQSAGQKDVREPEDPLALLKQGWTNATEPTKQWLDVHQEAMTVWRRGTEKERGLNLLPSKLFYTTILNVIQDQRMFVRLAMLQESRSINDGELDEAHQWARAAFRCGGHTTHRGCLIQGLVGLAIHAISSQGLAHWAKEPGVTSEQLRQALAEVQSDDKLYESLSNLLKTGYLTNRNSLRSRDWANLIAPVNPGGLNNIAGPRAMRLLYWVVGEPEVSIRVSRQILANQLPEIDKPIDLRRKMVGSGATMLFDPDPSISLPNGQLEPAKIDRAIKRPSLTRMLLPSLAQIDSAFLARRGRQATLEALLAAQAYRRDHGEFPESLAQLVPNYLAAVPVDPCDPAGGPLHYTRDEPTKAIIWSMGDDRADGGGVIDATNGHPPDVGFELK